MPAALQAAVIGFGSIGRRHAGLLVEAGWEVRAYDPVVTEPAPPGVVLAGEREEALTGATLAVIATPTSHHEGDAVAALRHGCHVLVEKPLATAADAARRIEDEGARTGRLVAVAMNLRFHPGPAAVRAAVASGELGRPLFAVVEFGQYLPAWRPDADYRASYSARSELGGGVLLDVVHELDYASWALGPITAVSAELARISDLEIDVEDLALVHLEHAEGTRSAIVLDYLTAGYRRGCRVVGTEATLTWDWTAERVIVRSHAGSESIRQAPSDAEASYRGQCGAFTEAARRGSLQGSGLVSAAEGVAALEVIDAARRSSAEGRRVAVR